MIDTRKSRCSLFSASNRAFSACSASAYVSSSSSADCSRIGLSAIAALPLESVRNPVKQVDLLSAHLRPHFVANLVVPDGFALKLRDRHLVQPFATLL